MHEDRTEVVVVGAGPTGLWTALLLAQAGIEVTIVECADRPAARSYACALHPSTLRLLHRFGLATPAIEQGRSIQKVAFYDGPNRQTEVSLGSVDAEFPFLLVLPQCDLESALEHALRASGVNVYWNHRFDSYRADAEDLVVNIEELGGSSGGYIIPHWETVVKAQRTIRTEFLIGADGANSLVRSRASLHSTHFGCRELFAVYEFQSDTSGDDEVRIVLAEETTNVLWPLLDRRFRWTFQLMQSEPNIESPEKERRAVRQAHQAVDDRIRAHVKHLAERRAPWFSAPIQDVDWCTQVAFDRRVVDEFGAGKCWLAGDAAHQTGPAGVQSLNASFLEADRFVPLLKSVLHKGSPAIGLTALSNEFRNSWLAMLGSNLIESCSENLTPWIRKRAQRILPCLPGVGSGLSNLAGQLGLTGFQS